MKEPECTCYKGGPLYFTDELREIFERFDNDICPACYFELLRLLDEKIDEMKRDPDYYLLG